MPPLRIRGSRKSVLFKQSILASVLENVNIILNCISALQVRRAEEDSDSGSSELLDCTSTLIQTVFWTVAEWKLTAPRQKICWCYPGRSEWFHDTVLQYWDDSQWIENFRMTRQTLLKSLMCLHHILCVRTPSCAQQSQWKNESPLGFTFLQVDPVTAPLHMFFKRGPQQLQKSW
ncbi:hypothetical protein JRQ81_012600 [Phrynocephalus forsythii]|uniref:Uncharacterized protein n=1 Tax=Phrynocephalus forsythii TaxID=171643 RepID=A0A9Q0Y248_9SAUR|nr:hypothetical protein JRQ81_012600 [Phrynocephalus forsythii]